MLETDTEKIEGKRTRKDTCREGIVLSTIGRRRRRGRLREEETRERAAKTQRSRGST